MSLKLLILFEKNIKDLSKNKHNYIQCRGGIVVQRLVVLGSNLGSGLFVCSLHVLPVHACVFSGFLLQSKNRLVSEPTTLN